MGSSPPFYEHSESLSPRRSQNKRHSQTDNCTLIDTNKKLFYVIPYNEQERYRLFQQHWILIKAFGGNSYLAPVHDALERGITVLDSGCGPGAWILDMATLYPDSSFIGTDIQACFPTDIKPANCHFLVHNIVNPTPYPDNHFEYIHQRLLMVGLVGNEWEKVISDHMRTLAPGGWIEYMEFLPIYTSNSGPFIDILTDIFRTLFEEKGIHGNLHNELEGMFANTGFVNIHTKEVICYTGQGDRFSRVLWEDIKQLIMVLKSTFKKYRPHFQQDGVFDAYIDALAKEAEENKISLTAFRIWAQKPQ